AGRRAVEIGDEAAVRLKNEEARPVGRCLVPARLLLQTQPQGHILERHVADADHRIALPVAGGNVRWQGKEGKRVAPGEVERVSNQGPEPPLRAPSASGHGTIRGTVLTRRHEPLCEATVAIRGGPTHPDIAALTDEQGQFLLSNLQPSAYRLTAHAGRHPSPAKQVAGPPHHVSPAPVALED